ncbi:hypothetical protein Cpir12675_000604 [Ceratocystis pirilliformis]|uniref:Uncharacterized protein n=1 Tax=Ceratocystis pirilliformis TaxID=259994 RepID=A0ABR3ZKI4_9PEZI
MKFLSASLCLVLPLLTFARATTLENNGYHKVSNRQIDSILYRDGDRDYQLINTIGFHPWMKMATIYVANNDIEPEHENKLSLPDIYADLAKRHKLKPEDVDWIVTEIAGDAEIEATILEIREGRNVGLHDEVTVAPNDKEWNTILGTKYYRNAASVNHKAVERVIIRMHTRTLLGDTFDVDSLMFHFPTQENTNSQEEASESVDNTENGNAMQWMDFWKKECSKGLKGKLSDEPNAKKWEDAALNIIYGTEKLEEELSLVRLDKMIADLNPAPKDNNDAAASRT